MQLVGPHDEAVAQTAVGHNAEHFKIGAAIRCALAAGVAFAAVHVRLDRASLSYL